MRHRPKRHRHHLQPNQPLQNRCRYRSLAVAGLSSLSSLRLQASECLVVCAQGVVLHGFGALSARRRDLPAHVIQLIVVVCHLQLSSNRRSCSPSADVAATRSRLILPSHAASAIRRCAKKTGRVSARIATRCGQHLTIAMKLGQYYLHRYHHHLRQT